MVDRISAVSDGTSIGARIKAVRLERRLTQAQAAAGASMSTPHFSQLEVGAAIPPLATLFLIHNHLCGNKPQRERQESLRDWLISWLNTQVSRAGSTEHLPDGIPGDITGALHLINSENHSSAGRCFSGQRLLTNFPHAFDPLMVILGDRREPTPSTQGDIFAFSLSATDLMFMFELPLLGVGVKGRSDKLVANMGEKYLQDTLGAHHLLVVGSAAVNLAARQLKPVFRPPFDKDIRDFLETISRIEQLGDAKYLRAFWKMVTEGVGSDLDPKATSQKRKGKDTQQIVPSPQGARQETSRYGEARVHPEQIDYLEGIARRLLEKQSAKSWTAAFKRAGFIDPADGALHATYTRQDNDFACISLAPNPWDATGEHVAILVAGLHGPGTAHALRMLGTDGFRDHPLGGIVEVKLPRYTDWPTTLEEATAHWQTASYTLDKVMQNLQGALQASKQDAPLPHPYTSMTRKEVQECIDFVRKLAAEPTRPVAAPDMDEVVEEFAEAIEA